MLRIHLLLSGLSFSIVLLSLNRLTLWTQTYLQPHEFLRFLDFNAMLPIPLFSIILYFLLLQAIINKVAVWQTKQYRFLMILFICGVYLFGAGSGVHEVTNYLNSRFCDLGDVTTTLCHIIGFNDDIFSHFVYYLGFVLLNISLMTFAYLAPLSKPASKRDLVYVGINGLLIACGIFANLAFEQIGFDLFFFGAVMVYALYLLFARGKHYQTMPILVYFTVSYTLGILGTLLYKAFIQ